MWLLEGHIELDFIVNAIRIAQTILSKCNPNAKIQASVISLAKSWLSSLFEPQLSGNLLLEQYVLWTMLNIITNRKQPIQLCVIYLDLIEQGCKTNPGRVSQWEPQLRDAFSSWDSDGDGSEWHWQSSVEPWTLPSGKQLQQGPCPTYRAAEGSGQERSYQLFSISGILGTSCLEFHVILAATLWTKYPHLPSTMSSLKSTCETRPRELGLVAERWELGFGSRIWQGLVCPPGTQQLCLQAEGESW